MHVENDIKLGFKDVMIRPKRSTLKSRSQVSLERTFTFLNSKKTWTGVPIIAANMDTVGTFAAALVLAEFRMLTAVHKHYSVEQWQDFLHDIDPAVLPHIMVSSGTSDADLNKLRAILALHSGLEFLCIDVANGYSEHFVTFLRRVRAEYADLTIVAGNVVTGEMTEELLLSGADIVKAGIGPGSVCTTRVKTGVGYPQVSAVIECSDAAHGLNGHVISDGGCTCPGDVSKAFGAGADFVMLGGLLAGHDESGGDLVEQDGRQYRLFYGMSSDTAMDKYHGGVANYRASEGKTVKIPYRGPLAVTMLDIQGGVRSTCTYVGAAALRELSKRTTFIRVQEQENRLFNS
ncbi:MAG: GMP reductase [Reinekea forsetii]|jgi:GMP reductase|uniref:GMP reductase n=1 Tax=Reinekea forsetii TaxID=1336806 RepID=A0A2K8KRV2_9GAMM|nr:MULTISPECIES: GMP reductase [Reinekea]ATX75636.1 guanosine 5'-monophosphate oxidoreductase [Reinekea forsetii]MDO7643729.1 GMP reductase [Reinekea forsetii]MDO7673880.1 GMP reductase [Reinekea forsetii]